MSEKKTIPKTNRIFVNRSLNFGKIKLVGFDMDHTLAPYKRDTFEALAFQETVKKLIENGYPEELLKLEFKPDFLIRGLLVDRERGNILKVDGHKYVKDAYHGHKRLTKEERHTLYNNQSFKAQDFISVDTFFALSEVQLFAEIVSYMDQNPKRILKSFKEIYADIKRCIDLCHADGSIKDKVLKDLPKYIKRDKNLAQSLVHLIDGNKSLFLLTNSHYEYTHHIMSYILDGAHEEFLSWKDYWDVIIVGASKPGFFMGNQPFFEVDDPSHLLRVHRGAFKPNVNYFGGNAKLFEQLTGYRGDEILYVGDHIYGDIIQSKGTLNWRTMLVIEEIDEEILKIEKQKDCYLEIQKRIEQREDLDTDLQDIRSRIATQKRRMKLATLRYDFKNSKHAETTIDNLELQLLNKLEELKALEASMKKLVEDRDAKIHPIWGALMHVGLERSRFANQVTSYACIYSTRASNIRFYSPFKKFTSFHDQMPHDH